MNLTDFPEPVTSSKDSKRSIKIIPVIAILLVFSAALLLSILALVNTINLSRSGVSTIATVTDWRIDETTSRSGPHTYYEVQYEFSVNDATYSYSDETGRRNLWCSIPQSAWDTATTTRQLQVLYQPDNPWNNRPVVKEADFGVPVILIVLFGGSIVIILLVMMRAKRMRARKMLTQQHKTNNPML